MSYRMRRACRLSGEGEVVEILEGLGVRRAKVVAAGALVEVGHTRRRRDSPRRPASRSTSSGMIPLAGTGRSDRALEDPLGSDGRNGLFLLVVMTWAVLSDRSITSFASPFSSFSVSGRSSCCAGGSCQPASACTATIGPAHWTTIAAGRSRTRARPPASSATIDRGTRRRRPGPVRERPAAIVVQCAGPIVAVTPKPVRTNHQRSTTTPDTENEEKGDAKDVIERRKDGPCHHHQEKRSVSSVGIERVLELDRTGRAGEGNHSLEVERDAVAEVNLAAAECDNFDERSGSDHLRAAHAQAFEDLDDFTPPDRRHARRMR